MALQLRYPEEADFSSRSALQIDSPSNTRSKKAEAIFRWSPSMRQKLQGQKQLTPDRLIVASGHVVADFMQQVVDATSTAMLVGTLIMSTHSIVNTTFSSTPSAICSIVSLSNETFALITPENIDESVLWTWIDALFQHIQPQQLVNLTTMKSLVYDTDLHEACSLQYLCTSNEATDNYKTMERLGSPRLLTGISAGLLTYCELRRKRCIVFILLHHASTSISQMHMLLKQILPSVQVENTDITLLGTMRSNTAPIERFLGDLYI